MSRKTLNILTIVLFAISIIVAIFTFVNSAALQGGDSGKLNPLFYWTFILIVVALALAIIMPIPALLRNPKSLKRTLFIIVGLVVLFFIVYALSTGTPSEAELADIPSLKRADYIGSSTTANMNLIGVYIMFGLAAVAVIWSAFKGIFTK